MAKSCPSTVICDTARIVLPGAHDSQQAQTYCACESFTMQQCRLKWALLGYVLAEVLYPDRSFLAGFFGVFHRYFAALSNAVAHVLAALNRCLVRPLDRVFRPIGGLHHHGFGILIDGLNDAFGYVIDVILGAHRLTHTHG